jgi:hypothetical protein
MSVRTPAGKPDQQGTNTRSGDGWRVMRDENAVTNSVEARLATHGGSLRIDFMNGILNLNATATRAGSDSNRLRAERFGSPSMTTVGLALSQLRGRLLEEALTDAPDDPLANLVRLAAVEAEARAWLTSFPLLLFPALFEEKAQGVRTYVARQKQLRSEPAAFTAAPRAMEPGPSSWKGL